MDNITIYNRFLSKLPEPYVKSISSDRILNLLKDEYKNINDIIVHYREFLIAIKSCMYTLVTNCMIMNAFFDSVVDIFIENNYFKSLHNHHHIYSIFLYISPEKMYELIHYLYIVDDNKDYYHYKILSRIYISILYHDSFAIEVHYLKQFNLFEKIAYPYYSIIQKLIEDNIIRNTTIRDRSIIHTDFLKKYNIWTEPDVEPNKYPNEKYELNNDYLFKKIILNLKKDMIIHLKPHMMNEDYCYIDLFKLN